MRLFRRCNLWCPTCLGWTIIVGILFVLVAVCFVNGESFLSTTHRLPADTLVVESWIGPDGVRSAVNEFERGDYRYIVASGGRISPTWDEKSESYAQLAAAEMIQLGIPQERVLVAYSDETESRRTFETAVAVRRALQHAGIAPKTINVFTYGPHARRSQLVFSKVNPNGPEIGVISWLPSDYPHKPWWKSSERARRLFEEVFGYFYELLLNAGRHSNSVAEAGPR